MDVYYYFGLGYMIVILVVCILAHSRRTCRRIDTWKKVWRSWRFLKSMRVICCLDCWWRHFDNDGCAATAELHGSEFMACGGS